MYQQLGILQSTDSLSLKISVAVTVLDFGNFINREDIFLKFTASYL